MNHDQAAGRWQRLKGRAKLAWGTLTDNDFAKAEGSVDALYGAIQERVGDTREAIQEKLMQKDREASRWAMVKRRAKKNWNQLQDADFDLARGSIDRLCTIIQEKYGGTEAAIRLAIEIPAGTVGLWRPELSYTSPMEDDELRHAPKAMKWVGGRRVEAGAADDEPTDPNVDRAARRDVP